MHSHAHCHTPSFNVPVICLFLDCPFPTWVAPSVSCSFPDTDPSFRELLHPRYQSHRPRKAHSYCVQNAPLSFPGRFILPHLVSDLQVLRTGSSFVSSVVPGLHGSSSPMSSHSSDYGFRVHSNAVVVPVTRWKGALSLKNGR